MAESVAILPVRVPFRVRRTLASSWTESRPTVQVVFALRALVGFAASPAHLRLHALTDGRAALGFPAWIVATFGVYLVNGICDAEEDRANGTGRPIGSGRLDPRDALRVYVASVAVSLVLAAAVGAQFLGLDVALIAVGLAYSARPFVLSRTTTGAAFTVFALGFLTYLAGAGIAGGLAPAGPRGLAALAPLLVVAVAMSAWMGLVGAVVKDLSDIAGDAAAGRRTLAVRFGPRAARRFVCWSAPAVGVGFVVAAHWCAPELLVPAGLALVGAVAVVVSATLLPATGSRAVRRRPYRAFMLTQYAVNLASLAALV